MDDIVEPGEIRSSPLQLCVKLFGVEEKKITSIDSSAWREHTRLTGELFSHLPPLLTFYYIVFFHELFVFSHTKLCDRLLIVPCVE